MEHPTWHISLVAAMCTAATFAPSHVRADEATNQFNAASGFFQMNRFDFAAEEYEKFLKDFPKHEQVPEATYFLGESYYHLNRHEDARGKFREVVSKHPNSKHFFYALFRVGDTSYRLGDHKSAEQSLTEFMTKRPEDPLLEYALPYLGKAQLATGKLNEAKATLRRAVDKFPRGSLIDQAQYDLAQTIERLGEKEAAIELYRKLAANSSSKLADDAQLALGTRYFEDKNYEAAMQVFQQLEQQFRTSPWVPAARLNRALCLYQLGRHDQAQTILEAQAKGESTDVPEAWYWLGMTQKARGQHQQAVETLLAGLEKFPTSGVAADMLFHAAQSLFQQSSFASARDRFMEFSKKHPKHDLADESLYYAGEAARALGEHERVFEAAKQLYKDFPKSPQVPRMTLTVAQSLIALGRHDEAARQLGELANRKPETAVLVPAQYYRAVALHTGGKRDEAIRSLEPLLADLPADSKLGSDPVLAGVLADAQFLAGVCHFEKKEYEPAVRHLQKYLTMRPSGDVAGHAVSFLAVSYASLGQFDQLRGTLDQLRGRAAKEVSLPALFRVAEACYDANQFSIAANLYTEVAQKDSQGPLHAKALSGLGWSQFQQNAYAPASSAFAQLVADHPDDPLAAEASYMQGRSFEADSKLNEAASAYRNTIDKYGKTDQAADAGLQLARTLKKLGKSDEAIAAYKALAERQPRPKALDVVLYEWAWACQQGGRSSEAQELFARLAKEFPASPLRAEAVLNVAESQYQAKQFAAVVGALKPALAKDAPPAVREAALYRMGRTHIELAAWSDSTAAFEQLLAEFPTSAMRREARFWMAEAARQKGDPKSAADQLAQLIAEPATPEPWLGTAYLRLAQCHGELKQWKELLATIDQLKKRFPKFEQMNVADYHAGRALQSLARFDEARESYRRAIAGRSDENAAQSQFMIGETFFHQKRYQEALREFLRVEILYAFPEWKAAALLEAAKCHEGLQEWSRAAETYNRILEKYPKTSHATEAAERRSAVVKQLSAGTSQTKD